MKPKRSITKEIELYLTVQVFLILGYMFFYYVQENVYGNPNVLLPISVALNNQTIATSFFGVGTHLITGCVLTYMVERDFGINLNWLRFLGIHIGIILCIYRELYQMAYMPNYVDWHEGDIVLSLLAYVVVFSVWIYIYMKNNN